MGESEQHDLFVKMYSEQVQMGKEVAALRDQLGEVLRTLKGTDGNVGLVARVAQVEKEAAAMVEVKDAVLGTADKEGVLGILKELHEWRATVNKWLWVVVAAAVSGLVSTLIDVFRNYITHGHP